MPLAFGRGYVFLKLDIEYGSYQCVQKGIKPYSSNVIITCTVYTKKTLMNMILMMIVIKLNLHILIRRSFKVAGVIRVV